MSNIENQLLADPRIKKALDVADPRSGRLAVRGLAESMAGMRLDSLAGILTPDGLTVGASMALSDDFNISLAMSGDTPVINAQLKVIKGDTLNVGVGG